MEEAARPLEVTAQTRAAGVEQCRPARRAIIYYRLRHQGWNSLRGMEGKVRKVLPHGCGHARWLARLWQKRAFRARVKYEFWLEEQRLFLLRDYEVRPGNRAWHRAVGQVQRAYPGTSGWLLSCSSSEGGWGRWVPNSQGSGVGGWLQFYPSTFWRMYGAAVKDVTARGFKVPPSAASWYSPLGQALAGAWGITHGRRHEWHGSGC